MATSLVASVALTFFLTLSLIIFWYFFCAGSHKILHCSHKIFLFVLFFLYHCRSIWCFIYRIFNTLIYRSRRIIIINEKLLESISRDWKVKYKMHPLEMYMWIIFIVQFILYNFYCTVFIVQFLLYNFYCTILIVKFVLNNFIVQFVLYNLYCTICIVQFVLYNLYCTICIVQFVLYNLYCTICIV